MFNSQKRAAKKAARRAEFADENNYSYKVWFSSEFEEHPYKVTVFYKDKPYDTTYHKSEHAAREWAKRAMWRSIARATGPKLVEEVRFGRRES